MSIVDLHNTLLRRRDDASVHEGVRKMPSIETKPSPCLGYTKGMKFMPLLSGTNYPGGVIHAFTYRLSCLTYLYIISMQTFDIPPELANVPGMSTQLFQSGRHCLRTILCSDGFPLVQIWEGKEDILEYLRFTLRSLQEKHLDNTFMRSGVDENGNLVKLFATDQDDNMVRLSLVVYNDQEKPVRNYSSLFPKEPLIRMFNDLIIRYDPLGAR